MIKNLVIVTWDDAWQDQENFSTVHGIKSTHSPMPVETIGILLHEDEAGISIANERSTQDGHDVFRGRTFVPKAMIRSVEHYNLTKPRAKRQAAPESKPQIENRVVENP